jgi:hypothetical protein
VCPANRRFPFVLHFADFPRVSEARRRSRVAPKVAVTAAALTQCAALTQNLPLFTIVETPMFSRLWPDYWAEDERGEFVSWLVANPEAGDVIRHSGGCRKARWSRLGSGKRGGVRVIYYNRLEEGVIYLLLIYAKNVRDSIDAETLNKIRSTLNAEDD